MGRILEEIRGGSFAEEWIAENRAGRPRFNELRARGREHQIEKVGADLRAMMPWISAGEDGAPARAGGRVASASARRAAGGGGGLARGRVARSGARVKHW